jgi:hypothetical protein
MAIIVHRIGLGISAGVYACCPSVTAKTDSLTLASIHGRPKDAERKVPATGESCKPD